MVEVAEATESANPVIDITLGDPWDYSEREIEHAPDEFAKSGEELRKMNGLGASFKRKTTRELQKVRESADGKAQSKAIEVETISGYLIFDVILPPYNLDYLAKLYEMSAPHYAAVKAKVSNIVGLGYQFVESPKIKIKLDEAPDPDTKDKLVKKVQRARLQLEDLFDGFNKEDSFLETLQKVWTDYEATGNGYIEVARKTNGEIGYIGHVASPSIRVRKQRDGFVQIVSHKVVFFRNFGDKTPDPFGNDPRPNELIHIKKYSPTNGFYGVPDIIAAQQAVAGNEFASKFNLDYFENKAVPRYVIISKGADLSVVAQRRLTEFFETGLKGKNHRTIYVPLPAENKDQKVDFEMKPVEAGTQDSSFQNYHKINVELILMAHRVPITKVAAGDGIPLAAARDLDKTFKEQVCRPEQTIFEKKIDRIVKELTDMFRLKLNELSLTDEDTQSQIDERNVRNSIDLPNEIRARRGLPAIKDGATTANEKLLEQGKQQQDAAAKAAKVAADAQKTIAASKPAPVVPGTTPAKTAPSPGTQTASQKQTAKGPAGSTRAADRSSTKGSTNANGRNAKGAGAKTP